MKLFIGCLVALVALMGVCKAQDKQPTCEEMKPVCEAKCKEAGADDAKCVKACDADNSVCNCVKDQCHTKDENEFKTCNKECMKGKDYDCPTNKMICDKICEKAADDKKETCATYCTKFDEECKKDVAA